MPPCACVQANRVPPGHWAPARDRRAQLWFGSEVTEFYSKHPAYKPDVYVKVRALYAAAAAANNEDLLDVDRDLLALDDNEVDEDGAPVVKPKRKGSTTKAT